MLTVFECFMWSFAIFELVAIVSAIVFTSADEHVSFLENLACNQTLPIGGAMFVAFVVPNI